MSSRIDTYFAGITAVSGILSAKAENSGRSSFGIATEESGRPGPCIKEDTVRTTATGFDAKVTISGSVVYEPAGLLADLAGSGAPAKPGNTLEAFSSAAGYSRPSFASFSADSEASSEPVTYTFEILV